jgi:hypothetical protein
MHNLSPTPGPIPAPKLKSVKGYALSSQSSHSHHHMDLWDLGRMYKPRPLMNSRQERRSKVAERRQRIAEGWSEACEKVRITTLPERRAEADLDGAGQPGEDPPGRLKLYRHSLLF